MELPYEIRCSRCHERTTSTIWGPEAACSKVYCLACVPRINVCGQQYALVKDAPPGKTFNNYVVHCPHYTEGCGWTGEVSQVESHLNPNPTEGNLLDGCQFQTVNFKRQLYKRNQQLHSLQKLKVIIFWAVLFAILIIARGLVACRNSGDRRLRVLVPTEESMNESNIYTQALELINTTSHKIVAEVMKKRVEELHINTSEVEDKCKKVGEEATNSCAKKIKKFVLDGFINFQDQIERNQTALESKWKEMIGIATNKWMIELLNITSVQSEIRAEVYNINATTQQLITDSEIMRKEVEELHMNSSAFEHKCKNMIKKVEEATNSHESTLRKLIHDRFSYLQNQIKTLQSNMTDLESKCKTVLRSIAETNTTIELETLIKEKLSAVAEYDRKEVQLHVPSVNTVEEPHSFWWNLLWNLIWYSWLAIISVVAIACIFFFCYILPILLSVAAIVLECLKAVAPILQIFSRN